MSARPSSAQSPVKGVYDAPVDRESAYEKLAGRAAASAGAAAPALRPVPAAASWIRSRDRSAA